MSAIDDLDFLDAFDGDDDEERPREVKCRSCGDICQWGYVWQLGAPRWFLVEDDGETPHRCGAIPAKADEFPLEPK